MDEYFGTSTTVESKPLTYDDLHKVMDLVREMGPPPKKVYQSMSALEQDGYMKTHNPRKGGGDAYHRRVQKKWFKRWGYKYKPAIFETPDAIFVHPSLYHQIGK